MSGVRRGEGRGQAGAETEEEESDEAGGGGQTESEEGKRCGEGVHGEAAEGVSAPDYDAAGAKESKDERRCGDGGLCEQRVASSDGSVLDSERAAEGDASSGDYDAGGWKQCGAAVCDELGARKGEGGAKIDSAEKRERSRCVRDAWVREDEMRVRGVGIKDV